MKCQGCESNTDDYCDKQKAYFCGDCGTWTMASEDDINLRWEVSEDLDFIEECAG